jgi:hypothetical protein
MKRLVLSLGVMLICATGVVYAQNDAVGWHRSTDTVKLELHLFRSPHAVSLPTAETLQKGNFEFEISHRFVPYISDGIDALYGFDGPVYMRLALAYAVTNHILVTLGRSNIDKNIDLNLKYRLLELKNKHLPTLVAVRAGAAWNALRTYYLDSLHNEIEQPKNYRRHFQYYLQGMINTMPHKKVGLGLVPSYLINRDIYVGKWKNAFVLGANANIYLNRMFSVIGEWSFLLTDKSEYDRHNPGSIGIELNTGGHFFKVFVTNQVYLNSSQYLDGATDVFARKKIHLGFLITRLIQ